MKQRGLLIFTTTAILIFAAVAAYIILSNPQKNMDSTNNNNTSNNSTNTPTPTTTTETVNASTSTNPDFPTTVVSSQTLADGLKIEDLSVGTGTEAKAGDTVSVNYIGTLADGTEFDNSYKRGEALDLPIGVGSVIKGWDEGVPGMKVGGKRKLTIPAELGYGSQEIQGVIPANSTLVFEIELVKVTPAQ